MAFLEGDIITADLLNSTNGETIEYSSGHLDSSGKKPYSFFFYLNRPTGDEFGEGECGCGYFSGSWITMYRFEDGEWVEKDAAGDNGGWYNCNVKLTLESFGEGSYKIDMSSSNYAWHRNLHNFANSKIDNQPNGDNYLRAIGPMELEVVQGSNAVSSVTYESKAGDSITLDMLNAKEVYASPTSLFISGDTADSN